MICDAAGAQIARAGPERRRRTACRIAWAALALSAITAPPAQAQSGESRCENPPPPFSLGETNRLRGAELLALVSGNAMTYVRKSLRNPAQYRYLRLRRDFRPDGSMLLTCETGPSAGGPWEPCRQIATPRTKIEGSREVGVWRVEAESLCLQFVSVGSREPLCFRIHRGAGRYYAKATHAIPNCVEGDVVIAPRTSP